MKKSIQETFDELSRIVSQNQQEREKIKGEVAIVLTFVGKKQIEQATRLVTSEFIHKNAVELEPNDSLFNFIRQTQNYQNRDKILNHFADKLTIEDEFGTYQGERLSRFRYLNYIIPTIDNPLITMTKNSGRNMYFKPFIDKKQKLHRFISITEGENNEFFVTAFKIEDNKNLRRLIKQAEIVKFNAPADTFALSARDGIYLQQSSTDETIPQKSLNKAESDKILQENLPEKPKTRRKQ